MHPFPYTDFPREIQKSIRAYETELDAIHPGWRVRERWGDLEYDVLARLKWLLKRHQLLSSRDPRTMRPMPRDWKVLVTRGKGGSCFAHAIPPEPARGADATTEPPPVAIVAEVPVLAEPAPPAVNVAAVALAARVPLEAAEAAAAALGPAATEAAILDAVKPARRPRKPATPDYANTPGGTE